VIQTRPKSQVQDQGMNSRHSWDQNRNRTEFLKFFRTSQRNTDKWIITCVEMVSVFLCCAAKRQANLLHMWQKQ